MPAKNFVRLRDAQTDEILAEQLRRGNDVAQKITWDLTKFAGRKGYFEATDGDTGTAYAWLAFGRFDPPVVRIGTSARRVHGAAIQIVAALGLTDQAAAVARAATSDLEAETPAAAAQALGTLGAGARTWTSSAAVVRE